MLPNRSILSALAALFFGFAPALATAQFLKDGQPNVEVQETSSSERPRGYPEFSKLIKELSPAVVNISVEAAAEDEAMEQMFPFLKKEPGQPMRSLGSGCIVSEDGYIITNNHVVDKSERIIVRLLDDKTEYQATLVGKDAKTDLALLKIAPKSPLKWVYFGDSDDLEVGEWVLAIGNQFQLGQTVTAGIVSAKSRRVPNKASGPYDAFIQTDASINPGSSGGPLFNTRGQLVGINTAIFSPGRTQFGGTGFNIGIGFSIPSNLVRTVVTQLKENGRVVRGLLGVIIQRVDGDMATALNLPGPDGALVADVVPNSPASKAGFQRKDVILSFNQQSVRDHEDLPLLVATTPIGSKVSVDILRGGKKKTLVAVIEELKEVAAAKNSDSPKTDKIGLVVQNVTEDVAKSLKMTAPAGALVGTVEPGSTAERAGIQRGDVIEELNGQLVRDAEHFEKLVPELPVDKPLLVMVRRTEGTRFLTMRIKPAPKS